MENSSFDFLWLLNLIKRHVRLLIVIFLLTAVGSSLVSLFLIQEKFKSSVVIYPTTTYSVSQALLVEHNPYRKDVLEFGEEAEAEQLLQILNSDEMRDSIINQFNLFNHYQINRDDEYSMSIMHYLYDKAIKVKKTQFNSIEISVLDKDPQLAADIANEYLILMEFVITRIRQNRANQALTILEKRKQLLYEDRNITLDSLKEYRRLHGVIATPSQTERLTEHYAIALAANNLSGARRIKKELETIAEHSTYHDMLLRKSYEIEEELAAIEFETDRVEIDTQYTLDNKFIINQAYPSDKKAYPIRWLIVVSSLIGVFIFSILSLFILESMNSNK